MNTAAAQEGRFGSAFERLGVERAWTRTRGSSTVTIAIVDHGVQLDHPLLGPNIQRNSAHRPVAPSEVEIAGTHAAGVAAGCSCDVACFSGVAPDARILPVRFGTDAETPDAAHAIEYAVEQGASIINLSRHAHPALPAIRRAIEYAATRNVLVVCPVVDAQAAASAGEPPNQLTVLSLDERCAPLTNDAGQAAHVAAPGYARVPRWRGNGHAMSCDAAIGAAYVSGCAALVKAGNPSWGYHELREHLIASARPLVELAGRCRTGRALDVARAVIGPIEIPEDGAPLSWSSRADAHLRWTLAYQSAYAVNVVARYRAHGEKQWQELAWARAAAGEMTISAAALRRSSGTLRVACRESEFRSDDIALTIR